MSATDDKFEFNGKKYHSDPKIDEFLSDAGWGPGNVTRHSKALDKGGITSVAPLITMSVKDLEEIKGITFPTAKQIYQHAQLVKHRGSIVMDFEGLQNREGLHDYLTTGSTVLDEMMTYSNGRIGLRSRTLIELFGEASTGKTQLCLTAAAMCLRPKDDGGWGRGVAYIDSEGAFDGLRFQYLARYWGVDEEFLRDNIYYARATDFFEVENAITEITNIAGNHDIGLVVVDSIMDPLKATYTVGMENLQGLQPRQQHLKKVLDMLQNLAEQQNAIVLYTNHVMANIMEKYGPEVKPQGGAVIAHASDIRIFLSKASKTDRKKYLGSRYYQELQDHNLKMCRAKIVDCGFLPETTGYYLMGAMGLADPRNIKHIITQSIQVMKTGYLSVNSMGDILKPIIQKGVEIKSKEDQIEYIREMLYGKSEDEESTKKSKKSKSETEDEEEVDE